MVNSFFWGKINNVMIIKGGENEGLGRIYRLIKNSIKYFILNVFISSIYDFEFVYIIVVVDYSKKN